MAGYGGSWQDRASVGGDLVEVEHELGDDGGRQVHRRDRLVPAFAFRFIITIITRFTIALLVLL